MGIAIDDSGVVFTSITGVRKWAEEGSGIVFVVYFSSCCWQERSAILRERIPRGVHGVGSIDGIVE